MGGAGPRRWRRGGARRGVSEVVATILLLGMTITMFASIFVFTAKNPRAQPQTLTQFTVALAYGGSGGLQVTAISITHLSGQVITGSSVSQAAVYVASLKHPSAIPSPFTLAAGLSGSDDWDFGQTWTMNLSSYSITSPDNLTVSVISNDLLEYRTTVVAVVQSTAPVFYQVSLLPDSIGPKTTYAFNASARLTFASSSGDTVSVNLTELGGSSSVALVGSGGSGLYYYSGSLTSPNPSGATTYYIFLTAKDPNGQKSMYAVPLLVTS